MLYQVRMFARRHRALVAATALVMVVLVAATVDDMERFFATLEHTLIEIGYLDPKAPKQLMRRLRRIFNRANPDPVELNILMGILAAARAATGRKSGAVAESESD